MNNTAPPSTPAEPDTDNLPKRTTRLRETTPPRTPTTAAGSVDLSGIPQCASCGHYMPEHFTPVRGIKDGDQRACARRIPDTTGSQCSCREYAPTEPDHG